MKLMLISLGCDKNLVDSEYMLGIMTRNGYEITDDENEAEIIIINTCSFIGDSKQESINQIISYGELKKTGKLKCLVCAGCLAQRYKDEIESELPEVDVIVGTTAFDKIADAVSSYLNGKKAVFVEDKDRLVYGEKRIVSTGGHYAYLKIAEGCDKKCTYCAIPGIRGSFRSVPMDVLIKEANELAEIGVKEIIIVAQETTVYGVDIYGKKSLHLLLNNLCEIEGIEWIRLLYCYPEEIYDELIETIKVQPKICHYLDIPIQHADDYILQRMGRRTNKDYLEKLIEKLRKEIPDICIRTTLIVGFPGETEQCFENLMGFVSDMEFDRLGVFAYSPEEGTIAFDMSDRIDDEIKEYRREECMLLQQEIAFDKARSRKGNVLKVMIEGRLDDGVLVARSYMDAPDVDGYVFIDCDYDLPSGTFVNVKITGSNEYDLIGEIVE